MSLVDYPVINIAIGAAILAVTSMFFVQLLRASIDATEENYCLCDNFGPAWGFHSTLQMAPSFTQVV